MPRISYFEAGSFSPRPWEYPVLLTWPSEEQTKPSNCIPVV